MLKLIELMTDPFERLLINYSNARKSWEAWCFLSNINLKKKNPELRKHVDEDGLLYHLRYLALKDVHIESYKILKCSKNRNNNKDNVFRFLKAISLSDSKHEEAMRNLNEFEANNHLIEEIINARDKYFAHLDIDYKIYVKDAKPINDLYKCFELIEKSIITLTSLDYFTSYLNKTPSRDEFVITCLNL